MECNTFVKIWGGRLRLYTPPWLRHTGSLVAFDVVSNTGYPEAILCLLHRECHPVFYPAGAMERGRSGHPLKGAPKWHLYSNNARVFR